MERNTNAQINIKMDMDADIGMDTMQDAKVDMKELKKKFRHM